MTIMARIRLAGRFVARKIRPSKIPASLLRAVPPHIRRMYLSDAQLSAAMISYYARAALQLETEQCRGCANCQYTPADADDAPNPEKLPKKGRIT